MGDLLELGAARPVTRVTDPVGHRAVGRRGGAGGRVLPPQGVGVAGATGHAVGIVVGGVDDRGPGGAHRQDGGQAGSQTQIFGHFPRFVHFFILCLSKKIRHKYQICPTLRLVDI